MRIGVELLAVVFIVLKLTHQIGWSWVVVLSPLWVFPAVLLAVIGIILLFGGITIGLTYLHQLLK
jgi:hypothetical protein